MIIVGISNVFSTKSVFCSLVKKNYYICSLYRNVTYFVNDMYKKL